jgi:hypothetical protein
MKKQSIQSAKPQTLAFALSDSPIGFAAKIMDRKTLQL